jgi:hypothetical protein
MDLVLRELEEPERAIRAGLVTHPADGSCVQRFIDGDIRVDSRAHVTTKVTEAAL